MMLATIESLEIETELGLSLFGTSSFYHIWEVACGRVFGNEVEIWKPFIPKPRWISAGGQRTESDTFIPDLVAELNDHELLIGDAKYYRPAMPPALRDVPGVNDVAKQIWYKDCLKSEAQRRSYSIIQNVFLFPRDVEQMSLLGHVELPAGGERIDAVAVPFLDALAIYSGDKPHIPQKWRERLSIVLRMLP
ncbi:LlaJI restriction endonuclease [Novosphingobium sp. PhB57]|nr:LlaJI restriction endonuclease [Novosphingobium sp. PhB57]